MPPIRVKDAFGTAKRRASLVLDANRTAAHIDFVGRGRKERGSVATPPPAAPDVSFIMILSGGFVIAVCGAVIAFLKWKQPPKP